MRPTQPYEAKQAPRLELDDPRVQAASHAAVTAVAGFVYTGDTPDAVMSTLRFLSARPDVRAALWPQTVLTQPDWVDFGTHFDEHNASPVPVEFGGRRDEIGRPEKERTDLRETLIATLAQVPLTSWRDTPTVIKESLRTVYGAQADNLIRVLSDIPVDPS